jgi:acyl-homoserine-lactone acylase
VTKKIPARRAILIAALSASVIAACKPDPAMQQKPLYQSEIRWTSYGIPHVNARDWGGLGYGFAYALATDGFCVYAREVATVNGELSAHLGAADGNFESDVFHRAIVTDEKLAYFGTSQSDDMNLFSAGFVAGFNRYLDENRGRLPSRFPFDWI